MGHLARPTPGYKLSRCIPITLLRKIRLMQWMLRHAGDHQFRQDCQARAFMPRIVLDREESARVENK